MRIEEEEEEEEEAPEKLQKNAGLRLDRFELFTFKKKIDWPRWNLSSLYECAYNPARNFNESLFESARFCASQQVVMSTSTVCSCACWCRRRQRLLLSLPEEHLRHLFGARTTRFRVGICSC
jgi:hypothetical protein